MVNEALVSMCHWPDVSFFYHAHRLSLKKIKSHNKIGVTTDLFFYIVIYIQV